MEIKIDSYTVNTDANGNVWITETKVSDNTGKQYETRVSGYCRSFAAALESMLERKVYGSDAKNLTEAINTIDETLKKALQIIKDKVKD